MQPKVNEPIDVFDVMLTNAQQRAVLAVLARCLPGVPVWVFGSRATGRARPFSDLDLLVEPPEALSWPARAALRDAFEATDLPFRVDIVEVQELAPGMRDRVDAEKRLLIAP